MFILFFFHPFKQVKNNGAYYAGVTWDKTTLSLYQDGSLVDSSVATVNRTVSITLLSSNWIFIALNLHI